jgi:hypothetical protein
MKGRDAKRTLGSRFPGFHKSGADSEPAATNIRLEVRKPLCRVGEMAEKRRLRSKKTC